MRRDQLRHHRDTLSHPYRAATATTKTTHNSATTTCPGGKSQWYESHKPTNADTPATSGLTQNIARTSPQACLAIITGSAAFYAFSVLPLAQTYAILFAGPLIITVLSIPILGEKVGAHRWGAVIVGLVGVLVVLRPGAAELGLGHLAALVAAICGALAATIVRKIGRDERSAVLLLYPMMANFILMAALLPLVYRPMPLEHLGLIAVMATLAFVAGLCLIAAYKAADAAVVAPMQYSQIIWATVFGLLFFDEAPDLITGIGAAIVMASGLYIVLREAFGGRSATTPVLQSRTRPETATSPRTMAAKAWLTRSQRLSRSMA